MKTQTYFKFAQSEEDRLTLAKMEDLSGLREKRQSVCFSPFLDEHQKRLLQLAAPGFKQGPVQFFGGYEGAQREIAAFLPDYLEELPREDFPLQAVRFSLKRPEGSISHRDYLGTILSLGVRREKIGDILVDDEGCLVFADRAIASLMTEQIDKVKNQGVSVQMWDGPVALPEERSEQVEGTVSSVRLDSVLALARRISREKAQKVIAEGRVQVNFMPVNRADDQLKEGDVLSVKGFGRTILHTIGNQTRKGRVFITVKNLL